MKNTNLFFIFLLAIGLIAVLASFKTSVKETNEYMTIIVDGWPKYQVYISVNGEYKEKEFTEFAKNKQFYNYNPVFKIVQEYESEGWELVSNQFTFTGSEGGDPYNYFLLKRKK